MKFDNVIKFSFNDVYIKPISSELESRREVNLITEYTFKNSGVTWSGIPIIAANMDTTGTFAMNNVLSENKILTAMHKFNSLEDWKNNKVDSNYTAVTIGSDNLEYLSEVLNLYPDILFIVLDVANGYRVSFLEFIKKVRALYPKKIIIAGNVVTPEATISILESGADIVKVGIGCGSACNTTSVTGVGYPQFSAVYECAEAAYSVGGHIISDGSCKTSGDIAKAFCAGASFVMLGGMLSGHDESGGNLIEKDSIKYKEFYGMSSKTAQEKHYSSGMKTYRASEGAYYLVKYKGPVSETINTILGGLRSTCTYINAKNLSDMFNNSTFIMLYK